MNLENVNNVYFLGIGGIGMSALARWFHHLGISVSGYDKTPSQLTKELESEGINICYDDAPELISSRPDLVVITPAIPTTHKGRIWLEGQGIPFMKRAEVLGLLTSKRDTIAVAGTHGKTTTSTMVANILYNSHQSCTAFLGGVARNFNTNLLVGTKETPWAVTEADEYDRSFLQLKPYIAIITAADADHLDIYGTHQKMLEAFEEFIGLIREGGTLILKKGTLLTASNPSIRIWTYALDDCSANCFASNIRLINGHYAFDLVTPLRTITDINPGVSARVNIENAVAACTASMIAGATDEEIRRAMGQFKGIRRRFDVRVETDQWVYIDDYAHHPEEIKALITSVRDIYPKKKITGLFQPHLYSRTRDFAEEFAESLDLLDEVVLLDLYPAREAPIPEVSEQTIGQWMNKKVLYMEKSTVLEWLTSHEIEVLLTIGAGDIDRLVAPIEELLINRAK